MDNIQIIIESEAYEEYLKLLEEYKQKFGPIPDDDLEYIRYIKEVETC